MAAVMRGGAGVQPKPRPKARGPRVQAKSRAPRAHDYRPAKLHAARHVGLNPRIGIGVAAAVFALGLGVALFSGGRSQTVGHFAGMTLARQFALLGFKTKAVRVQGAEPGAERDILDAAAIEKDSPILGVDLDALRRRIEGVGWVKQAKVIRLLPDTLVITVVPRNLMAVWQFQGVDKVVDGEGKVVPEADAGRYADLPLVVGAGAAEAAGAILPLLRQRPQLMSQLEAVVRVDGRRWDLRLKDGGIILLPAEGADSALIQLDQLEQKARVIELGFERIDLRDPDTVAVRPKGATTESPGGEAALKAG
jgi:cell division protein FtsQ